MWVNQIAESIPDHSKSVANLLIHCMSSTLLDSDTKNNIAFVAAVSSGNAELAFEIEMSSLRNSPLRETLKGIVSEMSIRNKLHNEWDTHYEKYFNDIEHSNYIYCFAIAVAQSCTKNTKYYHDELSRLLWSPDILNLVGVLSATVSSINKITL
jgi:hypothetical protein